MNTNNTWSKISYTDYLATITVGDTELAIFGEVCDPEDDIGYTGDVELYDVRIVCPEGVLSTSIWEMVQCFPDLLQHIQNKLEEESL